MVRQDALEDVGKRERFRVELRGYMKEARGADQGECPASRGGAMCLGRRWRKRDRFCIDSTSSA